MRLTDKEILEVTFYLVTVLNRKRFKVSTNKFGIITNAEKFGISCCPSIVNSEEDGKHGFSYIVNEMNSANSKDLGYYFKPHSNTDKKYIKNNVSIEKYTSENRIRVDMHNYKNVINTFAMELNKDYMSISKRLNEDESSIELDATNEDELDYKVKMLADYLGVSPYDVVASDYSGYADAYVDVEDNMEYRVLTDSEAQAEFERLIREEVNELYPEDLGIDLIDYIDEDYCVDYMKERYAFDAYDRDLDVIIDDLIEDNWLDVTDPFRFKLKDGVNPNDEDFDEKDIDNYELIASEDDIRELYIQNRCRDRGTLIDVFKTWFIDDLEEDVHEYIRDNYTYPPYIDVEEIINTELNSRDRGATLGVYDGDEWYLGEYEGESIYAYKIDEVE